MTVDLKYLPSQGLNWRGVLKTIPKAKDPFQALYEAFTNSLESIELRRKKDDSFDAIITLNFYYNKDLNGGIDGLSKIDVIDNGIGFDDVNFNRLQIFKDESKGFNNRGSGRIQLIHSFVTAKYNSIYDNGSELRRRVFSLSKGESFISKNAILGLEQEEFAVSSDSSIGTILTLESLRERQDVQFYNDKTIDEIKDSIMNHYLVQFCALADNLPKITINYYHCDSLISSRTICAAEIPMPFGEDQTFEVPLCGISSDMKHIIQTDQFATINIKSYKLSSSIIKKNAVKLTCKNEIIDSVKFKIACLPPELDIDSNRYLFLLSSDYFDNNIGDTRDTFEIISKSDFKKKAKSFGQIEPQVILDDIEEKVSEKASEKFGEISKERDKRYLFLQDLKAKYMLSESALQESDINDSVEDILIKAYSYDAKLIAKKDALYHQNCEKLESLDTTSPSYKDDLEKLVKELSSEIPIQNKESLSRYVTHRALVLELFEKLLSRRTDIQRNNVRKMDEKLIHNLFFSQHDNDTYNSDIWMLNEDYLYYKGYSESRLSDIVIDGKALFREIIDQEEHRYLLSLGENRLSKRPDILLFPSERKCVIIEFKSLEANVSNYLLQINKYASFIRSYTTADFYIDTFYGYLIGESIEPNDIRAADNDFKYDPKFDYCFRPSKSIACLSDPSGNHDGSIYTEAMSFSVVLERAKKRNEAFRSRLMD